MASTSYAVDVTKNIKSNLKQFQLQSFTQSTTGKDKNPICVSASTSGLEKQSNLSQHTMQTCKFNAIQRFTADEASQKKNMRKMKAFNGLAYRTKNEYADTNTTTFSSVSFVLPAGKSNTLYDGDYVFNQPSDSVAVVKVTAPTNVTRFSVEFFGYIIVNASSGVSNVSPFVTVSSKVSKVLTRFWIGDSAIANYMPETALSSSQPLYNNEIYPIRLQVSLDNGNANMNNFVVVLTMNTKNKADKLGLYTFVDSSNKLFVMKKYYYALERTSTGANNCYLYSSNTMPTNEVRTETELSKISYIAPAFVKNSEASIANNTSTKKATLTIGTRKYEIDYNGMTLVQNTDWLSRSGKNKYLSDGNPVYSNDGNFKATYSFSRREVIVYGYILNPKCDSTGASQSVLNNPNVQKLPSMADMYNAQVLEYNNTYILNDISRNVVQPIKDTKVKVGSLEFSTKKSDTSQWNGTSGFYPLSTSDYKKAPTSENTSTKCLKYSAEKDAKTVFFASSNKSNTTECYYNTTEPVKGEYSNRAIRVIAPASNNISSTMYIRNKTNPDTKEMIPTTTTVGYLSDVYQPIKVEQDKWFSEANKKVERFSGRGPLVERFSGSEPLVEGATDYLTTATKSSQEYSDMGKVDVDTASKTISEVNDKLTKLQSTRDKNGTAILYGSDNYNDANTLYDVVHPNSRKNAVDGHKQDEEELRLQYNNLFMVGSIAAATFSIAAIVTLSFSK
jgi:hypothetical protein